MERYGFVGVLGPCRDQGTMAFAWALRLEGAMRKLTKEHGTLNSTYSGKR